MIHMSGWATNLQGCLSGGEDYEDTLEQLVGHTTGAHHFFHQTIDQLLKMLCIVSIIVLATVDALSTTHPVHYHNLSTTVILPSATERRLTRNSRAVSFYAMGNACSL